MRQSGPRSRFERLHRIEAQFGEMFADADVYLTPVLGKPPVPLGQRGRRLQEIVAQPVEQRPLDLYAALAEVSR